MKNTFPSASPGRPVICETRNLPAFETMEELRNFFNQFQATTVMRTGKCKHCDGYHAETKMRAPSGASSGTERRYKGFP